MTSGVATIGLTMDGTDLQQSDLSIFLQITEGLNNSASVRGEDVVIPGVRGRIAKDRLSDTRRIVLEGFVRGVSTTESAERSDYRTNVDVVRALFDPENDPGVLVATLEGGGTVSINARSVDTPDWNHVFPSLFSYVSIVLASVDPDWVPSGS